MVHITDIQVDFDSTLSYVRFQRRIYHYIDNFINEGGGISCIDSIEISPNLTGIFKFYVPHHDPICEFFDPPLYTMIFNSVKLYIRPELIDNALKEYEYTLVINYINGDMRWLYINRDITEHREHGIQDILSDI